MTFVVHRAERADGLAGALAGILEVPLADPFQAEVVAVHSRGVERWLSHQLSGRLGAATGRSDGVCANLDFPFPGRMVGDALAAATGVDPKTDPWRPERLAWPLLSVTEANLDEPWLSLLAHHLGRAVPDSADRNRRLATVRHLADLFDRYAIHRPAMVRAWVDGRDEDGEGGTLREDLRWQAQLWRRLRHAVDTPSPAERLAEGCGRLSADPSLSKLPDRVSLFGLTRLPGSYIDVLRALAAHRDVHVLALHPSHAAWAEVARTVTATGIDAEAATDAVRHPLLRSWGRDSREMQLVLDRSLRAGGEVVERHHPLPDHEPTTLLQRLQHAIRSDAQPPGADAAPTLDPDDGSIQVHSCHGRARQAEVAREAITHLLADDPTLEPRHIVLLCPDIDEFAPLLHAAFDDRGPTVPTPWAGRDGDDGGDGPPPVPYRLADRSLRQTNPVLGALAELLALVDQRLTASQVLAFAALAPVRTRFWFDDDALDRLANWVEETGTRWGLDGPHRRPFDLAEVDAGTWAAGMTRLLLGVAMSEDDERLFGGALPLDDVDSGDIDLAGRMAELVSRLGDTIRDLSEPRPIAGWVDALNRAADLLFASRSAEGWQRSQLDQLLTDVGNESGQAQAAGSGPPLRLAEVRDLLADRLRGQPSRAAFRTGDLTMCTLVPMRSVPHRVVVLVGLDDGAFPRGGAPDGDDLLVHARHIGDHDRRSEDRQLLLDAVLAATDAVVITYAGRDVHTNEELPPAVPVNELLDVIDGTVRLADGRAAREVVVRQHPLQPSDQRNFAPGELGAGGPWSFDPVQLAGAVAASGPKVAARPFLPAALAPPPPEPALALEDLLAFAGHPTRAFLRQRLGLSLGSWDDRPGDALRVEMDSLEEWSVGDRLLNGMLSGADASAMREAEIARGLLPPGKLGLEVLQRVQPKAEAIAATARSMAVGSRTSLEVDLVLPDGRRLIGSVPDVIGDTIRPTSYSRLGAKALLAAWVRHLAATATHPDRSLRSVVVGSGGQQPATATFAPFPGTAEQRRARATELLMLVIDLHGRNQCEALPLFLKTSHAYAKLARTGRGDPVAMATREWETGFGGWTKEDRDPEHVLVLGGVVPFTTVLAGLPRADEAGAGWAMAEPTRFGRLARRLWDPVLDAELGTAAPPERDPGPADGGAGAPA